jgi:glycogen debranching enzyme
VVTGFKQITRRADLTPVHRLLLTAPVRNNSDMEDLVVLGGRTFFVSHGNGDIDPGDGAASGLMHKDTRHLSRRSLTVNGAPVTALSSNRPRPGWARIVDVVGSADQSAPDMTLQIDRVVVGDGVHEDLKLTNQSGVRIEAAVVLELESDFADLFEVRGRRGIERAITVGSHESGIEFSYANNGFQRRTRVSFSESPEVEGSVARFDLTLEPSETWSTCMHVSCLGDESAKRWVCPFQGDYQNASPARFVRLLQEAPRLDSDHEALRRSYRQAIRDLAALHFPAVDGEDWLIPAAGLPWFMAVFGRDSLISAYQALPFMPDLARSTLLALAHLQADDFDDFRDAEPGKILHELRLGELSVTGRLPFAPYYGSHDSTMLFLVLLDEYHRWTGDDELVSELEGSARAALNWIDEYGDMDGDGLMEYSCRSAGGLRNQAWKDSNDSMRFADGTLAEGPIAPVELQGYAYDARMRTARLAATVWGDGELATRLRVDAGRLKEKVNAELWHPGGFYVLALDGEKRQVDSLTSNMGHLLWSGLVEEDRAPQVVKTLLAEDLYSGWGVRTLAASCGGYNPLSYHNGSVWPHDNSLIAEGMRRYGFRDEASALVLALIEASGYMGYQLPELFSGIDRSDTGFPVEYPNANRPQAWASGSILLGLRTLMGLEPDGGELVSDPHLPDGIRQIEIVGLHPRGGEQQSVRYSS